MTAIVLSAIALSVGAFGFLFLLRYVRRQTSASRLLAEYREEVARLIATIDSATDRDTMLVEERIKVLRKFLEDADRRIAVYVKEVQRSRDGQQMYSSLGRGIRAALDSRPPSPGQPSLFAQDLPVDVGEAVSTEAAAEAKTESGEADGMKLPSSLPTEKSRLKARIAEMSARSVPRQEIASKLGISIAEVDLALNLLNRG